MQFLFLLQNVCNAQCLLGSMAALASEAFGLHLLKDCICYSQPIGLISFNSHEVLRLHYLADRPAAYQIISAY